MRGGSGEDEGEEGGEKEEGQKAVGFGGCHDWSLKYYNFSIRFETYQARNIGRLKSVYSERKKWGEEGRVGDSTGRQR